MLIRQDNLLDEQSWDKLRSLIGFFGKIQGGCCVCAQEEPILGLECTRPQGHDGPHIACGFNQAYAIWEDQR